MQDLGAAVGLGSATSRGGCYVVRGFGERDRPLIRVEPGPHEGQRIAVSNHPVGGMDQRSERMEHAAGRFYRDSMLTVAGD